MELRGKTQGDFMRMAQERALDHEAARLRIKAADNANAVIEWCLLALRDARQNHPGMVPTPPLNEALLEEAARAAAAVILGGQ